MFNKNRSCIEIESNASLNIRSDCLIKTEVVLKYNLVLWDVTTEKLGFNENKTSIKQKRQ